MRLRGADVADVAILMVSAEDGVKPQTLEALESIKAAEITYVVAINKIDKPGADIDRTKASLIEHEIYIEGMGGDVPWVGVSAKAGTGISELLDLVILTADLAELTGDTSAPAVGKVIEAKVDPKRKTLHQAYATWKEYFQTLKQPENIGVYHLPMYNGIYIPHDYEVDSAEKIHRMFSDYLEEQGINNWVVKIAHPGERTSFGVNQSTKVISIPHDSDLSLRKRVLTKVSLQALLMHEVGVHVVRRENGDASPLALLGVGLDDYLRAEEGIATLAEQLITGTSRYSGEVGYFSVGAAVGTIGNPLPFSELYTVLNAYYILSIADKQLETEGFYELDELLMTATEHAWNRAVRVYRGSTGNTVGAVYTRDIIYLEGSKRMWRLLDSEAVIQPQWLVGKYDPTNPQHVAALKELEILS
jgi:hypothetical protein